MIPGWRIDTRDMKGLAILLAMTSGKGNIYLFFFVGEVEVFLRGLCDWRMLLYIPCFHQQTPSTNIACKDQPARMWTTVAATGMLPPKVTMEHGPMDHSWYVYPWGIPASYYQRVGWGLPSGKIGLQFLMASFFTPCKYTDLVTLSCRTVVRLNFQISKDDSNTHAICC